MEQRENGQSRGFGFVTFKTIELSEEALKFNDIELKGRSLIMKKYQLKSKGNVSNDIDLMHPLPTIVLLMTLLQQVLKCIDLLEKLVLLLFLLLEI